MGDSGKHLVINNRAMNKVTKKLNLAVPKVKDMISKLNGVKYFQPWITQLDTMTHPSTMPQSLKQPSHHLLENMGT